MSSRNPDGTVRKVPSKVEKVRYRPGEGARVRSVLLANVTEGMFVGGVHLFGHEVDKAGTRKGIDHVITKELVVDRTRMVLNLLYGELEPESWQDEPDH